MQHKTTVIIESQMKVLPNGKKKLFIQARMNGYNIIESVVRDRLESVDEVYLGLVMNGGENESEVTQEIWTQPEENLGGSLVDSSVEKNNCSQLFITLRSKVSLIYNNILNNLSNATREKEKEKKEVPRKKRQRKREEKPSENGSFSEVVIDDDFFDPPEENLKYLKKIKKENETSGDVEKWTARHFGNFMREKFKATYGTDSLEFTSFHGGENRKMATGRQWTIIKRNLIDVFMENGNTRADILNYIEWAFGEKAKQVKFPLNLGFVCSKSMITEWMVSSQKTKKFTKNSVKVEELEFDM